MRCKLLLTGRQTAPPRNFGFSSCAVFVYPIFQAGAVFTGDFIENASDRVDEGDTLILEVACTAAAGVSVELVELRRAALAASTPGAD